MCANLLGKQSNSSCKVVEDRLNDFKHPRLTSAMAYSWRFIHSTAYGASKRCAGRFWYFANILFADIDDSQNNIFRYGEFCGPGPDESFWGVLKPVDDVDGLCQRHDEAYQVCLGMLSSQIGFDAPKFLHQIMPIRGLFPQIIRNFVFSVVPQFLNCMHHADNDFVAALDDHNINGLLPIWWSDPNEAPIGAQGVVGYQEACSLGVPWTGMCIVPSRMLFQVARTNYSERAYKVTVLCLQLALISSVA